MARTNACEEVSLKSSYALVAAGVVLGSLSHGGALYWCLVLMVALCAAAACHGGAGEKGAKKGPP